MLLVSVDVHLVLASCYLYILACWQNYYRKKKNSINSSQVATHRNHR